MPGERIDMGNLYRILRSLEREASSTPHGTRGSGPAKRIYVITQSGRRVLAQWVDAFKKIERQIEQFTKRYEEQRG